MSSSHSAIINESNYHFLVIELLIYLTIMGIKEHSIKGELGANSFADIKKIEHLLNRLVSLLSHASIIIDQNISLFEEYQMKNSYL